MTEVADDLYFVRGISSNWVVVGGGGTVTLIDCGYPGDAELVDASVEAAGYTPRDVATILVTHAHADHIGSAERYRTTYGTTIAGLAPEDAHLERRHLEQINLQRALPYLVIPRFLRWMMTVREAKGFADVTVGAATTIEAGAPLPLPGSPVAIATPGHTRGHAAYWFPEWRILVTGDSLITGHETSKHVGPQMLHTVFHHDERTAHASLRHFRSLAPRLVLPGHGDSWRGDLDAMVEKMSEGAKA